MQVRLFPEVVRTCTDNSPRNALEDHRQGNHCRNPYAECYRDVRAGSNLIVLCRNLLKFALRSCVSCWASRQAQVGVSPISLAKVAGVAALPVSLQ